MMESSNAPILKTDDRLSHYKYLSINAKDEIRIIVLLPPASPDESTLRCHLEIARLVDHPEYEAISYCWGAEVFPQTLHLPDGTLAITENLAAALKRFRLPDRPRCLWADAICINQQNIDEKSSQVALMARIYQNAVRVLVWLGEGSPEIHEGVLAIRKLASWAPTIGLQYENVLVQTLEFQTQLWSEQNSIFASLSELQANLDFTSLYAFTYQDWFRRLWVVQEYCLATKLEIHNGGDILQDEDLSLAAALLSLMMALPTPEENLNFQVGGFREFLTLALSRDELRLRDSGRQKDEEGFLDLVSYSRWRQCKLDQDRVYGMIAMNSSGVVVDYGLSVEDAYREFALGFLKKGILDILNYAVYGDSRKPSTPDENSQQLPQRQLTLPSWAPDWRIRGLTSVLMKSPESSERSFQAATKLAPIIEVCSTDDHIIYMHGVYIDFIEEVISPTYPTLSMTAINQDRQIFATEFSRLLKFKEAIDRKLLEVRLTGVDSSLLLARSLLFDDKLDANDLVTSAGARFGFGFTMKRWEEWYRRLADHVASIKKGEVSTSEVLNHTYTSNIAQLNNRAFIITKCGHVGVGAAYAEAGDVIAAFSGGKTPFVLRRVGMDNYMKASPSVVQQASEESWELVGDCFLNGFMNNEVAGAEWEEKRRLLRMI